MWYGIDRQNTQNCLGFFYVGLHFCDWRSGIYRIEFRSAVDWGSAGTVVNYDKLTYAGNLKNLVSLRDNSKHVFIRGDINDKAALAYNLAKHQPRAIVHFAAESHVDRSIIGPEEFIKTNVEGTFHLLEAALTYWKALPAEQREGFRFLHVSTDEVYGSLGPADSPFTESTPNAPNSPYAAAKAASDHFVRALSPHLWAAYGHDELLE